MGLRGPKVKPKSLRVEKAAVEAAEASESIKEFLADVPIPPKTISPVALAEWKRAVPELVKRGWVSKVDAQMVASYCEAVTNVALLERNIKHLLRAGKEVSDRMYTMLELERRAVRDMLREFGHTPHNRRERAKKLNKAAAEAGATDVGVPRIKTKAESAEELGAWGDYK